MQWKLPGMLVDVSNRVYVLKTPFTVVPPIQNGTVLHDADSYDPLEILRQNAQQGAAVRLGQEASTTARGTPKPSRNSAHMLHSSDLLRTTLQIVFSPIRKDR